MQEPEHELVESPEEEQPDPEGILYQKPKKEDFFVVLLLILLCLIFSVFYWYSESYKNLLWVSKEKIFKNYNYWRLFTAFLTHADIKHWLSNMGLLAIFGFFLRTYFGLLAFPITALLIGALTNLITIYFYPDNLRLLGASGIVYGLVAMWITFYVKYEVRYSFGMKIFRVLGFSMLLLLPTSFSPTTSYLSHFIGFILGIFAALMLIATGKYSQENHEKNKSV